MKKVLSLVLAVAMIFSCVSVFAASGDPVLTADNSKLKNDKTTVTISLSDAPNIASLYFEVGFDQDVLELLEVECEDLGVIAKTTADYKELDEIVVVAYQMISDEDFSCNGDVLSLDFKAISEKASTKIEISNLLAFDENGTVVEIATEDASFSTKSGNGGGGGGGGGGSDEEDEEDKTDDKKDEEPTTPVTPEAPEDKDGFTDIDSDDWYADAVAYVLENGIMNGVDADKFQPEATLTRGMFATILHRVEGTPAVDGEIAFEDILDGKWYADAVAWANANGIVKGISETEFAPNNNITREQIATIIYRYCQFKGIDVTTGEVILANYDDFGAVSDYAVEAIKYAVGSGLMKGRTDRTLNPRENVTRAEAATLIMRFIEMISATTEIPVE
ncbi:MAG: S-layer homology domain-containing protein [Clostridia bacterium]|nr:S-layer homology domain-containing protein [Clostridia bacterium]